MSLISVCAPSRNAMLANELHGRVVPLGATSSLKPQPTPRAPPLQRAEFMQFQAAINHSAIRSDQHRRRTSTPTGKREGSEMRPTRTNQGCRLIP